MKYEQINSLKEFLANAETALLLQEEARSLVQYPEGSISPWNAKQLDEANREVLDALSRNANVYAIFTAPNGSGAYSLRYIGKTTRKLARQRVRNHLIKKHENTGAKLRNVVAHVQSGGQVKISWIKIEPEALRNYLEEELIEQAHRDGKADWNR